LKKYEKVFQKDYETWYGENEEENVRYRERKRRGVERRLPGA